MARNQEKANAVLNIFVQKQKDGDSKPQRRPHLATSVTNLSECETWRRQVLRDISKEVAAIQNAGLGEFKIREMNDYINKLLREKKHWERQIKALGGPDYEVKSAMTDVDGKRALGTDGYLYFGAARELPGVRELFEQQEKEMTKVTRGELYKLVNAEYYGYKDEDDAKLLELEAAREKIARQESIDAYNAELQAKKAAQLKALGMDSRGAEDNQQQNAMQDN